MTWPTKTETDYKTVVIALLAGAGAGLAVGLLMAPKTGSVLRAEIGSAVDDYLDSARHKADEFRTSATNLAQRGLREVQRTKDVTADKFDKMKDAVSDAVETGVKDAHGAIDSTVAAVNSGAKKSHTAVDQAAETVRTGTRG